MKRTLVLLGLVGVMLASASARMPDFREHQAVIDSLRETEPWFRRSWLAERGLEDYYRAQSFRPDSQGLRVVGRWSYGPSVKVSLRTTEDDTIVCLARGSGASIIRFRSEGGLRLDLLSDIDCYGLVSRAIIRDTLVFIGMGSGGTGIEVWGVSDLTAPQRLSYVHLPPIMDIAVQDTFLYATGYVRDSLRIFSVADPRNPVQVGACADSGFPMHVSGDYCYLADRGGINIIDVSDPTRPRRVGKAGSGGIALSVTVRDTLCFFGLDNNTLQVYNVRNPANPSYLGSVSGTLPADLYLPPTCDTVLYTPTFDVISIRDPRNPRSIGRVDTPGWGYGVTAVPALNYALVADYFKGLTAVNIVVSGVPFIDTSRFGADLAEDIHVDDAVAYIANERAGLQLLDVSDPVGPSLLAHVDTSFSAMRCRAALGRDSFAYIGWYYPWLRTLDVTDPASPRMVGGCYIQESPRALAIRDSLLYVAMHYRFQVVNVARPREPEVVGEVGLPNMTLALFVLDTLAYVGNWPSSPIISISDPTQPTIIGNIDMPLRGIAVEDTFAYLARNYDSMYVYSVADPTSPVRLGTLSLSDTPYGQWNAGLVKVDSVVYIGGWQLKSISVADPSRPYETAARWQPPSGWVQQLTYTAPFLYAACADGGVAILETLQTGLSEESVKTPVPVFSVWPSITTGPIRMEAKNAAMKPVRIKVFSVTGELVFFDENVISSAPRIDLTRLPAGVYLVRAETADGSRFSSKVVRQ
ncbi:MAG: T9SS type A sorting domain-containing protein [bacterium]